MYISPPWKPWWAATFPFKNWFNSQRETRC
jgi:hypothetical protein